MVPKVAGKGKSFKGAAAYYLHDKKASTAERVAFTQTLNLPTQDADLAWRIMARTAAGQSALKQAAGIPATGRKLRDSVYCYSLAWAPDEKPGQKEMIAAARETLKTLGLSDYQALLVAHNDEAHPHIHVIVNRVHPETGKAASTSNDFLKLSRWAEAYEKQQGKIRCEQRVENNARRRSAFVKDRVSIKEGAFRRWQRQRLKEALARRQKESSALTERQTESRRQLDNERNAAAAAYQERLRDQMRRYWQTLYQTHRRNRDKIAVQQHNAAKRLRDVLADRKRRLLHEEKDSRSGHLRNAFQALVKSEKELIDLDRAHRDDRKRLGDKIHAIERDGLREIDKAWRRDRRQLGDQHIEERYRLDVTHSRQSQDAARRIKRGSGRLVFEAELAFKNAVGRLKGVFAGKAAVPPAERYKLGSGDIKKTAAKLPAPQKSKSTKEAGKAADEQQRDDQARRVDRPDKALREIYWRTLQEQGSSAGEETGRNAGAEDKDRGDDDHGREIDPPGGPRRR